MLIFPKATGSKFEITILFSLIEISNNYVLQDDLILPSPRGKGWKFRTLSIVHI